MHIKIFRPTPKPRSNKPSEPMHAQKGCNKRIFELKFKGLQYSWGRQIYHNYVRPHTWHYTGKHPRSVLNKGRR
jgi:hypothetical protein